MAVSSNKRRSRRTALAIALAGVMLPGMALAQEDRGARDWNGRAEHQADRGENRGNSQGRSSGEDRGGGWQRPMPQQASPQGQAASQPGGWQGRGNWAGHAQQTTPPPAQQQWGGNRSGSGWNGSPPVTRPPSGEYRYRGDGNRDGDRRGGSWQGQGSNRPPQGGYPVPGTTTRNEGNWRDRDGDRARRDGDRDRWRDQDRNRSGDNWRDRDRNRDRDGDRWRNGGNNRDYHRWDRDDWRRDNRYNWYGYRSGHRDLFRLRPYYAPYRNYYYRRIGIGFFLDALFYGDRYWIDDPWSYRLPAVYGPYRWVRYYDDVLLVDIYTGEVVDVIYDFFW